MNGGATHHYQYDLNGNMDSAPDMQNPSSVALRDISFNANNMPVSIKRDAGAVPQVLVNFMYDAGGRRARSGFKNFNRVQGQGGQTI